MSAALSEVIIAYAGRIGREYDRETLLGIIADLGRDLVGADRCSIWMVDEDRQELVTRVAHGSGVLRIRLHEGLVGDCVASGQPVLSNSMGSDRGATAKVGAITGYRTESALVVPIRSADGKVMAAFQALNKSGGFQQSDAALLSLAAAYSGQIIEGQMLWSKAEEARRLGRELEIAREVQQRLLPPTAALPALHGLDLAVVCRPASEVGGDYYDYLQVGENTLAFSIGDVAGKGISAALMMASVQASLRALVLQSGGAPAELFTRLNQMVSGSFTSGRYSTLFFGILDTSTGELAAVNAGHVYPILLRAAGGEVEIESSGPPVGMFPSACFTQHNLKLYPGDSLICFSDGLCEPENPAGDMWDEEEFRAAVAGTRGLTARDAVDRLVQATCAFAGSAPQRDDITAMLLRLTK